MKLCCCSSLPQPQGEEGEERRSSDLLPGLCRSTPLEGVAEQLSREFRMPLQAGGLLWDLVPSRLRPLVEVEGPPLGLLLVLLYRLTPRGEVFFLRPELCR
jgi:hypothetical protein